MLKSKNSYHLKMIKNGNEKYQKVAQEKVVNAFYCEACDYSCVRKYNFTKHKLTASHNSLILSILHDKPKKKYICNICDYTTVYKCNLTKHNLSAAHTKVLCRISESSASKNICLCGKEYKFMSGLTRHKQVCKETNQSPNQNTMLEILKDNKEFKELLIEQNKKIIELTTNATVQTTNYNTHNNIQNNTQQNNITFNLNYFLNEKCKNAINMSDFIDSMETSFKDLENTGKNGLVKSISQYITRELSKLDICDRPIHCSDLRRKILHIKERDEWQKDTDEQKHTKNSIRKINHKMNVLQIPKWLSANPNSNISDHSLNEVYLNIVSNTMDCEDKIHDIITNISDMLVIDKKKYTNMMGLTN